MTETETFGPVVGTDVLEALIAVRRALEVRGLRLCCQGARVNVWPSGQLRQFMNGQHGYVLAEDGRAEVEAGFEVVDLLDAASAALVVSVDEQHQFVRTFHGLPSALPAPHTPAAG